MPLNPNSFPTDAQQVIYPEQIAFGAGALSRLHEIAVAETEEEKDEHTFGFKNPVTMRIEEAIILPTVPHYERMVQSRAGIFLLRHSEVMYRPPISKKMEEQVE